ncbi:cytochrome c, partial [Novosphingobium sp. 1949]
MKRLARFGAPALLALALAVRAAGSTGELTETTLPGVDDLAAARVDYMLKCQGCHHPDGSGNAVNTPPLAGQVARFLHVAGGRAFIARVPGVASTDLDDRRTARVLNYSLYRFDRAHLPADFTPYTAQEIGRLRRAPLRLERAAWR